MFRVRKRKWNFMLPLSIISVVMIMIAVFFHLTSRSIVTLSKNNLALRSMNCADQLDRWTNSVITELEIYKQTIEDNFNDDDAALDKFLSTIYQKHPAYPMGIYIGDESGYYGDSSGWIPGEDWVLEERPWYIDGRESTELVFGEPYVDSMTKSLCISASVKMEKPGVTRVMSADVYLDYAKELVTNIAENANVDGAIFVTEEKRIIIADSASSESAGKYLRDGTEMHNCLNTLLDEPGSQHETKSGGETYYVNVQQMDSTGWYLITYVKKQTLLRYLRIVELYMALAAVIASLLLTLITMWFADKFGDMQKSAKTDKLTKILNRGGFEDLVEHLLKEQVDQGILLIMDMDNFKSINDNLGHPEGDKVLTEYAQLLENFFNRRNEIVARLGGDEFAVYIRQDLSEENLRDMLNRFQGKMKQCFDRSYEEYHLSSSIGAAYVKPGMTYTELYKLADEALYEVKRTGKNRFKIVKK